MPSPFRCNDIESIRVDFSSRREAKSPSASPLILTWPRLLTPTAETCADDTPYIEPTSLNASTTERSDALGILIRCSLIFYLLLLYLVQRLQSDPRSVSGDGSSRGCTPGMGVNL